MSRMVSFDNGPYCQIWFKERKKEGSRKQTGAQAAPQCLCELHFSVGFPEEQLKSNTSWNKGVNLALFLRRTSPHGGISCRDYADICPGLRITYLSPACR